MERERYQAELMVLSHRLPANAYRFRNIGTCSEDVLMAARTNSGRVYTLRIELANFPVSVPKVFVTKMLKDKNGNDLSGISGTMTPYKVKTARPASATMVPGPGRRTYPFTRSM